MKKYNYTAIKLRCTLLLALIFTITGICGTLLQKEGKNITIVETTLLNPKYALDVTEIAITTSEHALLSIKKTNTGYIGLVENIIFPVLADKVHELERLSTTTTQAEFISNKEEMFNTYGVNEGATQITFSSFDRVLSRLFFGSTDFTNSKRYIRSSNNLNVYSIADAYYSFLQTNPSAWVDPKIFPEILTRGRDYNSIASLQLTQDDTTIALYAGDTDFQDNIHTMLSLQTSNVATTQEFFQNKEAGVISLHYFDGTSIDLHIAHNDESSYLIKPMSHELSYALEISLWTYEKLISPFSG